MSFFNNIYFTIYSVESLIPAIFMWLIALFLLTIPNRSKASYYFGMTFLFFGLIPVSYTITSSIFSPVAGYNRWIAAYTTIPTVLFFSLFYFYFPTPYKTKLAKKILLYAGIVIGIGWIVFIISTFNAPAKFNFSGHYWDLDAKLQQEIVAGLLIICQIIVLFTGFWRYKLSQKHEKKSILYIILTMTTATIVPAVTNVLSRVGIISRGFYMTTYDLSTVIGMFMAIIVYINHTKDRTSFMGKIIGISLVTFLLLLQFVSNAALRDKETAFNNYYTDHSQLIINNIINSEEASYISEYSLKDKFIYKIKKVSEFEPDFKKHQQEYYNTFFYELINHSKINTKDDLLKVLNEIKKTKIIFSQGYLNSSFNYIANHKKISKKEFLQYIQSLNDKLLRYRIKINKFKNQNLKDNLKKYLLKKKKVFAPFQKEMLQFLSKSKLNGSKLKSQILKFIAIVNPSGKKVFRKTASYKHYYVSFIITNLKEKKVTEIGYPYLTYRKYMHESAKIFVIILFVVIAFIAVGFRFFFSGALLEPLNNLLEGLKKVQKGDSSTKIEVHVEDEIGFITRSFNSMVRSIKLGEIKLQRYADGLEKKVKKRTLELSDTLKNVQILKEHQDGDYFLTSLILHPLGPNNARSKNVKVDFDIEQKKKFKFRKWSDEIGGDICISDNIVLSGSSYVFFLNGDAMGKSLQGAGGALVLGAALQSILERTKFSSDVKKQSPEKWLKNSFSEMHTIFESFDGSMLMSVVLGLVEEKTGLMYFLNAEHPYTALYRNGKASFLEKDSIFRKLGSSIISGRVSVKTVQLKHNDVVFVGSDGRDDFLLGTLEDGTRNINEDEKVFLNVIEEAKGDLYKIRDLIKKKGELTDDYSVIRIQYFNSDKIKEADPLLLNYLSKAKSAKKDKRTEEAVQILESVLNENFEHPLLDKALFRAYLSNKEYDKAVQYGEKYCKNSPHDTNSLYAFSVALKLNKDYNKAIDYGERVRLRDPEMVNNLINLAESYIHLSKKTNKKGILKRAKKIAEEALGLDSDNERVKKIIKSIEQNI